MFYPSAQDTLRVTLKREWWRSWQAVLGGSDIKSLVFLDESSINLSYTRTYGRAKRGERIFEGLSDVRFERKSILSTVRLNGDQTPFIFNGTLNKELFADYLRNQLAPTLKEGDTIVLDNSSVHKSKLVRETAKELGLKLLFLPPYSPDMNPIELLWSYMKNVLRRLRARTMDALVPAIETALSSITNDAINGWFQHCGYGL